MKHIKLYVKEVSEERRELTIEEQAIWCISKNGKIEGYYDEIVERCTNKVNEIGLVKIVLECPEFMEGLFRTETTREATPSEVEAWHYLKCLESGAYNIIGGCSVRPAAERILRGKEIYPEVVED